MRSQTTHKDPVHAFTREIISGTVVISLEIASMEADNASYISRSVVDAFPPAGAVVIDLGELRYFDVSGFAAILGWVAVGRHQAEVRLCSDSGTIRALFGLLRANAVVHLYRNREDAIASLPSAGADSANLTSRDAEEQLVPQSRIA